MLKRGQRADIADLREYPNCSWGSCQRHWLKKIAASKGSPEPLNEKRDHDCETKKGDRNAKANHQTPQR